MKHKEELNKGIKTGNDIYLGISKKALDEIKLRIRENKQPLCMNNIDAFSFDDLIVLMSNIKAKTSREFSEELSPLQSTSGEAPVLKITNSN